MEKNKSRWEWQSRWLDLGQLGLVILLGVVMTYKSVREDMVHCLPFRPLLLVMFLLVLPILLGLLYNRKKIRQSEEGGPYILVGAIYYYIAALIVLAVASGICDSIASPY